jgi:hypothetical protein
MKSKRLHIIIQIVGFLLCSVGILYICQFFTNTFEEGFQATVAGSSCSQITNAGRKVWMCDTDSDAIVVLNDISNNLTGSNDNVCIKYEDNPKYYTCYTQPPDRVYDDIYGVYRKSDPILDDDTMPTDLIPSIDSLCSSSNNIVPLIINGIRSTVGVIGKVRDVITITEGYATKITRYIDTYCQPRPRLSAEVCTLLNNNYTIFQQLPENMGLNLLIGDLTNTLNNLSNQSTNINTVYTGIKCS